MIDDRTMSIVKYRHTYRNSTDCEDGGSKLLRNVQKAVCVDTLDRFLFSLLQLACCRVTQLLHQPMRHLDTGFSWFLCVYKQTLRRFPTFQVATTCFSCSPPDLNLLVTNFMFCLHVK